MKWKYRAAAIVLALAACTAPNPNYVGGAILDGGVGDGAPGDGNASDGPAPLDMTPVCMAKQRTCLAQSGSAACEAGQFKLDRKCPNQSTCASGYCQPPPASSTTLVGTACDPAGPPQENVCFSTAGDMSCEPFVDPSSKKVSWFCDKAVGMGLPGSACTRGDDCRSGFCGSNGTCFRACLDQTDCPFQSGGGPQYQCSLVTIVVEGEQVHQKSCIP